MPSRTERIQANAGRLITHPDFSHFDASTLLATPLIKSGMKGCAEGPPRRPNASLSAFPINGAVPESKGIECRAGPRECGAKTNAAGDLAFSAIGSAVVTPQTVRRERLR